MSKLHPNHVAALIVLETLCAHVHDCDEGYACTRAPHLLKLLDRFTRFGFTTKGRKKFMKHAIDRLAESHPRGADHGRRVAADFARLFPKPN